MNQLTLNHAETAKAEQSAAGKSGRVAGHRERAHDAHDGYTVQDTLMQARGDYEAERPPANLNELNATSAHTQAAELREQVAHMINKQAIISHFEVRCKFENGSSNLFP